MGLWSTPSLALAAWCFGPPILPPVPGERPAEDAPAAETSATSPAKPVSKPAPAKAPPPGRGTPDAKTNSGPDAAPPPAAPPPGSFSIPTTVEPPQPKTSGSAPPPTAETSSGAAGADAKAGSGGKSTRKSSSSDEPPLTAPRIGEEAAAKPRVPFALPPPARPPYRGLGLFIASGTTFAIALTEQIIAHRLVKKRCIDPISQADYEGGSDAGEVAATCAPGVLPALALRVHSDISLIATIGLATAGAMTRGNSDAYADVFDTQRRVDHTKIRIAGVSLLGVGVVSWLSTGVASWGVLGNCGTARCVDRARIMAFTTRDVSVAMVAAGAGMLAFSEVYRRRHDRYTRDRALSVGPVLSGNEVGFTVGGSF